MAIAVTHDVNGQQVVGTKFHVPITIVPDAAYPLGGEAITAAQCGLNYIERIIFDGPAVDPDTTDNAVVPHFVPGASPAILLFWSNSDSADGPLVEVAAATDLSAYTLRAIAVGW